VSAPGICVSGRRLPPNVYRFTPGHKPAPLDLSDFFRYELDIRELKWNPGYKARIRRRLKWSAGRYTRNVIATHCLTLTAVALRRIRNDRLTAAILAAFENGGNGEMPHSFYPQGISLQRLESKVVKSTVNIRAKV
jgi:hypothetical protein